jgi:hypothetical protein
MVYASVLLVYISIILNKGVLKPTSLITGGLFYLVYLIYIFARVAH